MRQPCTDRRNAVAQNPEAQLKVSKAMSQFRIGVIGLGRIGRFHAETLNDLPRVGSLVLADAVPEVAEVAARKLDAEAVADPLAMITSGIDGLVIAAGTASHPELIAAGVDAGVPVFCEKPVAPTTAESAELLRAVGVRDVPIQMGHQRRFDPAYRAIWQAVRDGDVGWLHTIRSTTLDPEPPPAPFIASSAGIFPDCGVHDFDVVRWISGREVVEVYAVGANRGDAFFAEAGDVDTAAATLLLEDGTIAVISNARYNGGGYDCRLEVHGSRGTLVAGWDDRSPVRSTEQGGGDIGRDPHRMFMVRFEAAYRAEFEAFLDVVAGDASSPCTVQDAVAAGRIAEAATTSLKEHRPVRVSEVAA